MRLGRLLVESPVRRPRWRDLVVCLTPEGDRVVPRVQLAGEFRAAGLHDAEHEVMARRVGVGEVLAYVLVDGAHNAEVAFLVLQLGAP